VSDTLPMHLASEGPSESYEDLLSLWSDLESSLGMLLLVPENVQGFQQSCASSTAGCKTCWSTTATPACT
jgi:hypothetical protein